MKRFLLAATAAVGLAAVASVASAQTVNGTINVTGTVAPKCSITSLGTASGGPTNFTDTFALGELSEADGTLRTDLEGSTAVGDTTLTLRVACTGSNVQVSVNANTMDNGVVAPTNYDSTIDFTANAAVARVGANTTTLNVPNTSTNPSATTSGLGTDTFLANGPGNVVITAYSFFTNAPGDILTAGSYSGSIVVSIGPPA